MFLNLKKQQSNQGQLISPCTKKSLSLCFSKYNFLMIKFLPQYCEYTKIHEAKRSKARVTNIRERMSGGWQKCKRMGEVKGGKAKCGPVRARMYKDCGGWGKKDIPLENASGKGTPEPQRRPIKLSRAQPNWKIEAFPTFYHWSSSCTTMKLDFKVSSPLSHR